MHPLQKYKNEKFAIYGMGLTGFAVAKTLKKLNVEIFCWDDNQQIRKKIKKNNFKVKKFWVENNFIDKIVISPGIDINKCKKKNNLLTNSKKIITDLDLFFEFNRDSLIISITGTNGKSTTCKIIEQILNEANYKVKTVGNIGSPIFAFHNIKKRKEILILEVSSYQLQYSNLFRSKHAAILNISNDHMDRHKNLKNYIKIKSKIFLAQKSSDYSYVNLANKYSKSIIGILKKKRINSKIIAINYPSHNLLLKKIKNKYFTSKGNIENMIFAYKIAKKLKVSDNIIIKSLNKFKGLSHRQEIVFKNKKLLCINDSKATSFDACLQSLSNYNKIYWIVGGLPKDKDKFYLEKVKKRIVKAYIIGKNISFFRKQIGKKIPFSVSYNIKNAIRKINKDLKFNHNEQKTILLSPAAASFDQFINFENRGDFFKKQVIKKFKFKSNV